MALRSRFEDHVERRLGRPSKADEAAACSHFAQACFAGVRAEGEADLLRAGGGGAERTPEDFIRLAASQSHLTGKPYLVKLADGKTLSGGAWLTGVLAKYRASHPE